MVEAYILMNCESGKAGAAAKAIGKLRGVKSVKIVTGLHDIVALVQAKNLQALATSVVNSLQKVKGISRTLTMVCVDI